jgi:hypothetical protein
MRNIDKPTYLNLNDDKQLRYKGFNGIKIDGCLVCRQFKFEPNTSHTLGGQPVVCETGFHACECPAEVFMYYPPAHSRYGLVEQAGCGSREARRKRSTKIASEQVRVIKEIPLKKLLMEIRRHRHDVKVKNCRCLFCRRKDGVSEAVLKECQYQIASSEKQHRSLVWTESYNSIAAATTGLSVAVAEQFSSVAAVTNSNSLAAVLQSDSIAVATGMNGIAEARGRDSIAVGVRTGQARAFEYNSIAITTGELESAITCDKQSVAVATGREGVLWLHEGVGVGRVLIYKGIGEDVSVQSTYFRVDKAGIIVLAIYNQYRELLRYVTYLADKDFELGRWYQYYDDDVPKEVHAGCFVNWMKHPNEKRIPLTEAELQEEIDNEEN